MTYPENSWSQTSSKALNETPWLPNTLLVVRGLKLGSYEGAQVMVDDRGKPRQAFVSTWPEGHLRQVQAQLMLAQLEEHLMHTIVHHYGIQGELADAWGSPI